MECCFHAMNIKKEREREKMQRRIRDCDGAEFIIIIIIIIIIIMIIITVLSMHFASLNAFTIVRKNIKQRMPIT